MINLDLNDDIRRKISSRRWHGALIIAVVSVAILLHGSPFASGAFDVKQICHDAVSHELRTHYGLSSNADYSVAHESVASRPGNTKEVHGDGRYELSGSAKTFKFDCVVNLSDGRVKYLAVHH